MYPSLISVLVTARPSWAKLAPIIASLADDPSLRVDIIGAAYALTHDRGGIVDPAFQPTTRITAALDANTGESSALTTGLLTLQLAQHLAQTQPRLLVVCADRHETLAGSIAASYQNIPVLHLQGGEVSGNIDDRVRRANTALADWHAVSHADAYGRVVAAGAWLDRVWMTGCPSIDVARMALADPEVTREEMDRYGTGASVDPYRCALVLMHPTTTHPETAIADLQQALALTDSYPRFVFWAGADTGHDAVSKWLRGQQWRQTRLIRSLPPARFLRLLSQAAYAVGNSSSLIREASYYGVPRVILGDRQQGRPYTLEPSHLYGDGYAVPRIVDLIRCAIRS